MTLISTRIATVAFASALLAGTALAQAPATTTTTTPATKMAPAEKKMEAPRTAASLQCSKDADAKGVHGKERKKFMSSCKKDAKDAAKPK